jgi:hypothetical protein
MRETHRREFLRAGSFALLPAIRTEAELVLHNGRFFTVDTPSHARMRSPSRATASWP